MKRALPLHAIETTRRSCCDQIVSIAVPLPSFHTGSYHRAQDHVQDTNVYKRWCGARSCTLQDRSRSSCPLLAPDEILAIIHIAKSRELRAFRFIDACYCEIQATRTSEGLSSSENKIKEK